MKAIIRILIIAAIAYAFYIFSPQILPKVKPLTDQIPSTIAKLNLPLKFWPKVQEVGEDKNSKILGTDNISETISQTQQDLLKAGQEKIEEAKTSFIKSLVDKFYEALINKLETERSKVSDN